MTATTENPPAQDRPATGGGRPALVWDIHPEVQHYRIAIWDGLNQRGAADGVYALKALGSLAPGGGAVGGGMRPYIIDCPHENYRRLGIGLSRWPRLAELIRRDRPDVVIMDGNTRNTDCWRVPKLCRELGIATVAWTKVHSYSRFAPVMKLVKPRFFSRFDCAVCYGESSRRELLTYGFPADRTFVANNTIDTRRIFAEAERIETRGRELRAAAGLEGRKILLCIGRMDPEKRHHDLLDAWPRLAALDKDLVLVIVSGGPMLEEIRARAATVDPRRIVVTGRVPEGDDYAWISACNAGIYPGAVGLAINISLAFGKPTIIASITASPRLV